jgi:lysozyme family protein
MEKILNYKYFLCDKEFESIINQIFIIKESDGKWTSDKTYEWDLNPNSRNKLKSFLSKLPKEKIKEYFNKFLNRLKSLPSVVRKKFIKYYVSVFISLVGANYLLLPAVTIDPQIKNEILALQGQIKQSSFFEAQKLVKGVEQGYSSDKKDTGNWIKTKKGKIFIGTNHGVSAIVLQEYLGRVPTQKEMEELSYQTALKIYKNRYWDQQNLSQLKNQSIANILYDGCINQGINKMKIIMRSILEKNEIEIGNNNPFSEEYIEKINQLDQEMIFNQIKEQRENKYREAKTFKRHGKGWLNRLDSIEYKEILESRILISDQEKWKKFLPKELKIITSNGDFILKHNYPNTVIDHHTLNVVYSHNTMEDNDGDALADGEPDNLEFDIYITKENDGTKSTTKKLKLNVDITYGDAMVSEFTISPPNKIKVGHYTSVHSKYDSETMFAFSDDSIKKLVDFFNRFSDEYKLTTKDFNFLDKDPNSYTPDYRVS